MLKVFTSIYSYNGPNRLDITAKGNDPIGKLFAPSWDLVMKWKNHEINKKQYVSEYYKLMRKSYLSKQEAWDNLLGKDTVVLVCFEKPEDGFCHRLILAGILQKLGADYRGELKRDGTFWGKLDLNEFKEEK